MHLIESYALQAGSYIGKPHIYEKYFPLNLEKYVIIHTTSKDSKTYNYFPEVISIIKPILDKQNIKIVQVGGPQDIRVGTEIDLCGKTDINQTAFIIKNCMGIIGVDSFPVHLSGINNKPIVALYSNNYKECVGPYFGDKNKQILFEPESRKTKKPSFSNQEHPKTINEIKPEEISKAFIDLLNKEYNLSLEYNYSFKSLYFGETYHCRTIENVPNQIIDIKNFGIDAAILRMDIEFNENILAQQLNLCPCSIVTNKEINKNLLLSFRSRIKNICYVLEDNYSIDFIKMLHFNGLQYSLLTYQSDKTIIGNMKLQCMHYNLLNVQEKKDKVPDKIKCNNISNLFYKSNQFFLSNGKIYMSKAHVKADKPIDSMNVSPQETIDSPEFWSDFERMYFIEKN